MIDCAESIGSPDISGRSQFGLYGLFRVRVRALLAWRASADIREHDQP